MNIEDLGILFGGYSHARFRTLFPHTIFDETASMKIGCCIGFIYGLKLAGKQEEFEYYANNFIKVFNHPYINPTDMIDSERFVYGHENKPKEEKFQKIPEYVCQLSDDGSALSFVFNCYKYSPRSIEKTIEFGWHKDKYQFAHFGGIIFHGIQQQFSVTLDKNPGWQIHT